MRLGIPVQHPIIEPLNVRGFTKLQPLHPETALLRVVTVVYVITLAPCH